MFEDGGQTRDFVHVHDVARANVLALTRPRVPSGPYNIGSGTPRTVGELARTLSQAVNPSLEPVVTGGWRTGDVRHIVASSDRAAEVLGFAPQMGFKDGMADFARAPQRAAG